MDNKVFTQEREIFSSLCDSTVKLGTAHTFSLIQDSNTGYFNEIELNGVILKKRFSAFWVVTRTKIEYFKRPEWQEKIKLTSFLEASTKLRVLLRTECTSPGGDIAYFTAKQEYCALSLDAHRPVRLGTFGFPECFNEKLCVTAFEKSVADEEKSCMYEQRVFSQSIDFSQHLNNVEYVRLALNALSTDYLNQREPQYAEIHYSGECKEGQILSVNYNTDGNIFNCTITENQRTAARLFLRFIKKEG